MTHQELWKKYIEAHPQAKGCPYEAWHYGSDDPDTLLRLTLDGIKTATASAYPFYEYEQCPLPKVGDYDIILNTQDEAKCIIQTTMVTVVPFCKVSERQADKEGEGDRSLAYWKSVHRAVFTEELREIDVSFAEAMPVVCQEFSVVFRAED